MIRPARLVWMVAILPFVTVHLCYLVSAMQGYVDWCVPYWDSCTSISRTGRHGASYFLFKGGMIPTAILMMLFWFLNAKWLALFLSPDSSFPAQKKRFSIDVMVLFGVLAGLFLMLYTLTLGHHGDQYHAMRRVGVVCYFVFTFICQVLTNSRLLKAHNPALNTMGALLQKNSVLLMLIGVLSLVLDAWLGDAYDDMEDAFEWVLALMINLHFFGLAWLWQKQNVRLAWSPST